MAKKFADRVLETTTTTGTGPLSLAGALVGYQAFSSAMSDGDTCDYSAFAVDSNGNPTGAWETGLGTYGASGDTLTRTTIQESSNGNNAVNFAGPTTRVGLTINAATVEDIYAKIAAAGGGTPTPTPTPSGPKVVQSVGYIGNDQPPQVAMTQVPAAGNLLIAMGAHYNNNPSLASGWTQLVNNNGGDDGQMVAYKTAGANESQTQSPWSPSSDGGVSMVIMEVSGFGGSPTLAASFNDNNGSTLALSGASAAGGINVGFFSVQTSTYDYTLNGGAVVDSNTQGGTNRNSPRRIKGFHVAGTGSNVEVDATLDSGHTAVGVMLTIAPAS